MKRAVSFILILALFLSFVCNSFAANFSQNEDAIEEAAKSVLLLVVRGEYGGDQVMTGSGFIAFDDSTLITNYHVIEDASAILAYDDNDKLYMITNVLCADKNADIAILAFSEPTNLKPLTLYPDKKPKRGSPVVTIGSPEGFKNSVSKGDISNQFIRDDGIPMIQFTAAISHGSSGGVLLNNDGKVIGVTTASLTSGQSINFAVNISVAQAMYNAWDGSMYSLSNHPEKAKMDFTEVYQTNETNNQDIAATIAERKDTNLITEEDSESTLLATVDGLEIMSNNTDLQYWMSYYIYELTESGYDTSAEDLLTSVKQYAMLNTQRLAMVRLKAKELNLDTFTTEETSQMEVAAKVQWEELVESYMKNKLTEKSIEDDEAAARADAEAQLLNEGYTEDAFVSEFLESQTSNELITRLRAHVAGDVAITDEDIQARYDEHVKEDQEMYGSDVATYEFYTQYYGQFSYYIPEGYRGVTHILLEVDKNLLNTWKDLTTRYDEQQAADATPEPTAEPVTEEQVEAARKAILDNVKEKVDEIYARLDKGESFDALIVEFGTDSGMKDDATRAQGYPVHKDSIIYDPAFTEAAMALEKVGDWSKEPVVSSFGVHILYYLRDIPGGAAELTDQQKEDFRTELLNERMDAELNAAMDKWLEEADIVWTEEGEAWRLPEDAND